MVGEGSYAGGIVNILQGEEEERSDIRKQVCSTIPRKKSQSFTREESISDFSPSDRRKSSIFSAISSIAEVEDRVQSSHVGIIVEDG